MNELTKDEAKAIFGKAKIWSQPILVQYLSGIGFADELFAAGKIKGTEPTSLKAYENGLVIEVMVGFSFRRTGILYNDIRYMTIEPKEWIVREKDKSVVGRAILGGLVAGPMGAMVGSISGAGKKSVKVSTEPDNLLIICTNNGKLLAFGLKDKHVKHATDFITRECCGKLKSQAQLEIENMQSNLDFSK